MIVKVKSIYVHDFFKVPHARGTVREPKEDVEDVYYQWSASIQSISKGWQAALLTPTADRHFNYQLLQLIETELNTNYSFDKLKEAIERNRIKLLIDP
jgi:hypothetical protein